MRNPAPTKKTADTKLVAHQYHRTESAALEVAPVLASSGRAGVEERVKTIIGGSAVKLLYDMSLKWYISDLETYLASLVVEGAYWDTSWRVGLQGRRESSRGSKKDRIPRR